MQIENIPQIYLDNVMEPEVFVYDFKMTADVVKSKVNLGMHMFSFLQIGTKQVHYAGNSIAVNKDQSLLLKKGNWLWTELLDTQSIYYCKLLFFSDKLLQSFLTQHAVETIDDRSDNAHFIIRNDDYIDAYLRSLSIIDISQSLSQDLLAIKVEELLLYLCHKYGRSFTNYLQGLVSETASPFKKIVESKVHSNLKLEEIAFLCNMSLSTFKRHFVKEYEESPGRWLQHRRLQKAKRILEQTDQTPSEIYLQLGYNNLSNFSTAFKNKHGISPTQVQKSQKGPD